jgi:DNA-directed RNA polymerase subunit M/transcription elongation factor TFIIS
MGDGKIPECIECQSTEVVAHQHDLAAFSAADNQCLVSYECVECGCRWQPAAELSGQSLRPLRRYS